jgi:hypothetical protein
MKKKAATPTSNVSTHEVIYASLCLNTGLHLCLESEFHLQGLNRRILAERVIVRMDRLIY